MGLREKFADRRWFIEKFLWIEDEKGKLRPLGKPRPEQQEIIDAWNGWENLCIVKPRQIGASTIVQALAFRDALLAPDPIRTLTLAHEGGTTSRMNTMQRTYWRQLPSFLRPPLAIDNMDEIQFGHNGATLEQYTAGGRGQGRSKTFQQFIAEEMAFWPMGSASVRGGAEADRNAWASVLATLHDNPYRRVVAISTGDGPSGLFYDVVMQAREDPDWRLLFFAWFDFHNYERDPGDDFELTPDEREYMVAFLGKFPPEQQLRKMAWRRWKMTSQSLSLTRFRREYPSTVLEPFMQASGTWFDAELADKLLGRLPHNWRSGSFQGPLRVYREPEEGRVYHVGMDSSGGTGRDYAVIVVLRDDFEVCAVWQSNTSSPTQQATEASRLAAVYNRAVVLCEENNYGRTVNDELQRLGARVWRDVKGNRFWSQAGRAGESKMLVYTHARKMFDEQLACHGGDGAARINDEELLRQIAVVRESKSGNVEAPPGLHDDVVDAWCFALWCGKHYKAEAQPAEQPTMRRLGW